MLNALTIDVEDYFMVSAFSREIKYEDWPSYESRVENNTLHILEILEEHEVKATFFVLGWIAERYPKLVKVIQSKGHEISSHGYSHQLVYSQTPEKFREETRKSKNLLEDIIGEPVNGYRAASYSIIEKSLWALNILIEEGFLYDSSIFPIRHDRYGIPQAIRFPHIQTQSSGSIQEYPLSTLKLGGMTFPFGGGGYLRLYPYTLTAWAIKKLNQIEKQPAIVYIHPWEIDPDQPKIKGSAMSRFRHYVNISKMESVLKNLLKDYQFAPLRDLKVNAEG